MWHEIRRAWRVVVAGVREAKLMAAAGWGTNGSAAFAKGRKAAGLARGQAGVVPEVVERPRAVEAEGITARPNESVPWRALARRTGHGGPRKR